WARRSDGCSLTTTSPRRSETSGLEVVEVPLRLHRGSIHSFWCPVILSHCQRRGGQSWPGLSRPPDYSCAVLQFSRSLGFRYSPYRQPWAKRANALSSHRLQV